MRLAVVIGNHPDDRWKLASQLGVTDLVCGLPYGEASAPWEYAPMKKLKQRVDKAGFKLSVIESSPPMDKIRLGLAGRDEEIEYFCTMLRSMGKVGIPIVCYNFMAVLNWLRTAVDVPGRGGALVTAYDHRVMERKGLTEAGIVPEKRLWANFEYFIRSVAPVAEKAKVLLALHPDDPPLSPIRGLGRIFRNIEGFQRAMDMVKSENNGITFCQGNFAAMYGVDIPQAIRHFGKQGRIHFVHFRDVRGKARKFVETFHDNGPTDMFEAMKTYKEIGFKGPMRPDHVPTMQGDANDSPGYTMRGRLYAIGYMRGLIEAIEKMSAPARKRRK
ncbi:MAG: mannonate dehydratase [Planctomycetes bacterium]|nr:mannonate dehydratase [Planctomycetota bacterium]